MGFRHSARRTNFVDNDNKCDRPRASVPTWRHAWTVVTHRPNLPLLAKQHDHHLHRIQWLRLHHTSRTRVVARDWCNDAKAVHKVVVAADLVDYSPLCCLMPPCFVLLAAISTVYAAQASMFERDHPKVYDTIDNSNVEVPSRQTQPRRVEFGNGTCHRNRNPSNSDCCCRWRWCCHCCYRVSSPQSIVPWHHHHHLRHRKNNLPRLAPVSIHIDSHNCVEIERPATVWSIVWAMFRHGRQPN